jgi:hypothetical protein
MTIPSYLHCPEEEMPVVPIAASLRSRLTPAENELRRALLACLLAVEGPVTMATAGQALGWSPAQTAAVAGAIVAKKLVVLDGEGGVQYAYPVSAVPSAHRVTLADGRTLYAMCAIDALGCCFEFGQPAVIESACQGCGAPVRVAVAGPTDVTVQPPGAYAVHVDLDKYEDWATKT